MSEGFITKLTKANVKGNSLRTTVPAAIRDQFGLKEGDKISWKLDTQKNEIIIVVKPIKK